VKIKKCRPIIFKSDGPNLGDQETFPIGPNLRARRLSGKLSNSPSTAVKQAASPTPQKKVRDEAIDPNQLSI